MGSDRKRTLTAKQKREIEERAARMRRVMQMVMARVRVDRRVVNAAVAWHKAWEHGEHKPDRLHQAVRNLLTLRSNIRAAERDESADV